MKNYEYINVKNCDCLQSVSFFLDLILLAKYLSTDCELKPVMHF